MKKVENNLDDNRRYVIIANQTGLLSPIRHIVEIEAGVPYFQDEFSAWYYDRARQIEGDEFVYCLSTNEMHEKKAEIEQKWNEKKGDIIHVVL